MACTIEGSYKLGFLDPPVVLGLGTRMSDPVFGVPGITLCPLTSGGSFEEVSSEEAVVEDGFLGMI